jgi:hypothetical protein
MVVSALIDRVRILPFGLRILGTINVLMGVVQLGG